VLLKGANIIPTSWSHDGRFLLYSVAQPKTRLDLWVLPIDGDRKPFAFLATESTERDAEFSPDGRWVAYTSNESGREEVYVRAFSPPSAGSSADGKWLISRNGGSTPRWLGDGRELSFLSSQRASQQASTGMVVEVFPGAAFQSGPPRPLLSASVGAVFGDATADGKRLLGGVPTERTTAPPFNVILNWPAGLKQ
jgi:dipeptidyl aminopeptidase/acylaminoacyl peptidase